MPYASFFNQFYHLSHFAFAFWLLFLFLPRYLFRPSGPDGGERFFHRLAGIVLLYIGVGYTLAFIKLYEVLAFLTVLILIFLRRSLFRKGGSRVGHAASFPGVVFYDALDLGFRLKLFWQRWFSHEGRLMSRGREKFSHFRQDLSSKILLLAVLAAAAYLRFYDALIYAAPPLSDSYVTLAWMKYIEERVLFHDGIYPQGFHIILATLHKFSGIDPLYVLKYMGPLVGLLITIGLYFVTSRWSKNPFAGIVAASFYGIFGFIWLGTDWERQAATNSQEFALLFLLPSLYFYSRYLQGGRRGDLWAAWFGYAVIGLVHSFVFLYAGVGLGAFLFAALLFHFRTLGKRVLAAALSGMGAVILSLLPLGLGKLLGREINHGASEFLHSYGDVAFPVLHLWDYAGLTALLLMLLIGLILRFTTHQERPDLFAGMMALFFFLLYELGGHYTGSVVLATRSGSIWALTVPLLLGFAWSYLWSGLRRLKFFSKPARFEAILLLILLAGLTYHEKVKPILPYKMEWNAGVEQYLRIAATHRPLTWMIVSQNEGYDLALGNGYHMYLGDFLARYDPNRPPLTRADSEEPDRGIPTEIYIYHEKKVFRVSRSMEIYQILSPTYERREEENRRFKEWLTAYRQANGEPEIYYEDEVLAIYHISLPNPEKENRSRFWQGMALNGG